MAKNEAKVRFTAETGDFNKQIKQSNEEMSKLRAEMKLNAEQMKDTGATVEGLEKKHTTLQKQLAASQQKTEAMAAKLEKAKQIFGENSAEAKKLETQLLLQQTAQVKLERAVANAAAEIDKFTAESKAAESETAKLSRTIDDQQSKLNDLKKEYSDAVLTYGENSKEAKDLAKEINSLSSELSDNKSKMDAAEKAADKMDNSLDDVSDSADNAEGGFSRLDGAISVFAGNTLSSLVDGIGNVISSFASLSEETQEYREDIGKLKTAWESAGKSTELATAIYKDFYSVLGEEDRSIEAVNHLAKFVETEQDMAKWTDIAAGVWGTFGDSLPIEGLTEASNETAKVGKLTGALADALNWAGVNEDDFQESLDKCNDEQERAELITDTLNGLYEDAAGHYKENNKSIIEARKATSDYTDTMAELGAEMEPLNTEITELKNELAKELTPVIKKDVIPAVKGFLSELKKNGTVTSFANTVLPPLAKTVGFIADNFGTLVAVIGIAVIAFKSFSAVMAVTASVSAAKTAIAGLATGISAITKVQTVWNAAMAANPIGAVITAVGLLAGGIMLLSSTEEDAVDPTVGLTEAEKELAAAADETAQAFRDQQTETQKTIGGIQSEMSHVQSLANELDKLVGKKGKVKETDEARVQFILGELNGALGTEYKLTDGIVQKYDELKNSINGVIQAKTANMLLEASQADYVAAKQAETQALADLTAAEKAFQDQKAASIPKITQWETEIKEHQQRIQDGWQTMGRGEIASIGNRIAELQRQVDKEKELVNAKDTAYNDSLANYANYSNTIMDYEDAQTAVLQGNYDRAMQILAGKGAAFSNYSDEVSEASREAIDALYKEAVDAGIEADRTKRNFEAGIKGYTAEMVKEAEKGYNDALNKWATAYDSAHSVGSDLGGGLKAGMEGTRSSLITKAKSLVNGIISAMRKQADSHSPSRETMSLGEDMGEGAEIGLESKTADVVKAAKKQVSGILGVYSGNSNLVNPLNAVRQSSIAQESVYNNAADTVDNRFVTNGFMAYIQAVEDLANRAIELNINGRAFATATASDADKVNGNRMALSKMGLAL